MRLVALALLLLACSGSSETAGQSTRAVHTAGACDIVAWSAPEPLRTREGRLVFVEAPVAVAGPRGSMLIGQWMLEASADGVLAPYPDPDIAAHGVGILLRPDGFAERIPMPVRESGIAWPAVGVNAKGGLTILWSPNDSFPYNAPRILAAEFLDSGWTAPRAISSGVDHNWGPTAASQLVRAGSELRILVSLGAAEPRTSLLLRKVADTWHTAMVDLPEFHLYPRLAALPSDTVVMAYVAGGQPDGNTLFIQRASVDGQLIGERVRISVPGAGPVKDHDFVTVDSVVYLVWRVSSRAADVDEVHLATSTDGGASWVARDSFSPGRRFEGLSVGRDTRGRLHMGTMQVEERGPGPLHAVWDGRAWRSTMLPQSDGSIGIGRPVLIPDAEDGIRIVWGAMDPGRARRPPRMLQAKGRFECTPRGAGHQKGRDG